MSEREEGVERKKRAVEPEGGVNSGNGGKIESGAKFLLGARII